MPHSCCVRLPVGHTLKDKELVAFKKERDRIDALLKEEDNGTMKLSSAGNAEERIKRAPSS